MRFTTGSGVLAGVLALAGCGAEESASPFQASSASTVVESVTGSAHTFQTLTNGSVVRRRLAFQVSRREDGSVDGSWQLVAGASIISGSLICFSLLDDGAVRVGGTVDKAFFTTFQVGSETGWYLEDDGEGAAADDRSGRLIINAPAGTAAQFCDGTYTDPRAEEV
ncbi:MAG TPA: hypothetical protein VFT04_08465, partial [Gemmatimonadales bacterium]|nr:hypothetical protein [Gemmatimonadales bacterium]